MSVALSVVLCTPNPRSGGLGRTLAALQTQTLPPGEWELLLIQPASGERAAAPESVGWHPHGRIVSAPAPGLTPARRSGIAAAQGRLLVFVDDDHRLAPDYLEQALALSGRHPRIGAFGGNVSPGFETPPAAELAPWLEYLGLRHTSRALWSNHERPSPSLPRGAGLCVRSQVSDRYTTLFQTDARRGELDKMAPTTSVGADYDLALCACDLGLGTAIFPELRLTRAISSAQASAESLVALAEATHYQLTRLAALRDARRPAPDESRSQKIMLLLADWTHSKLARRFRRAARRGAKAARRDLQHGN